MPLSRLVLDPANARRHDQRNMDAIRASLARFGPQWPLAVVTRDNVVRAGNGRIQAARDLGWTEAPVIYTDLDDVDATAFAIADYGARASLRHLPASSTCRTRSAATSRRSAAQ